MPHLIEPIRNRTVDDALIDLRRAHEFMVDRANQTLQRVSKNSGLWGIESKRAIVDLKGERPSLIGKTEEKLGEVINIAATVERLIAALEWFKKNFEHCSILECHPSTSADEAGNDIVLVNGEEILVRCEVCDIASSNDSNDKEKNDLRNLGCDEKVPSDDVRRYICTSREFAECITRPRRRWPEKHYRYEMVSLDDVTDSCLLLIQDPSK